MRNLRQGWFLISTAFNQTTRLLMHVDGCIYVFSHLCTSHVAATFSIEGPDSAHRLLEFLHATPPVTAAGRIRIPRPGGWNARGHTEPAILIHLLLREIAPSCRFTRNESLRTTGLHTRRRLIITSSTASESRRSRLFRDQLRVRRLLGDCTVLIGWPLWRGGGHGLGLVPRIWSLPQLRTALVAAPKVSLTPD